MNVGLGADCWLEGSGHRSRWACVLAKRLPCFGTGMVLVHLHGKLLAPQVSLKTPVFPPECCVEGGNLWHLSHGAPLLPDLKLNTAAL